MAKLKENLSSSTLNAHNQCALKKCYEGKYGKIMEEKSSWIQDKGFLLTSAGKSYLNHLSIPRAKYMSAHLS